jgi:hypothetical protein
LAVHREPSSAALAQTKDAVFPTRIDVLFKNVRHIDLRTSMTGLTVEGTSPAEVSELLTRLPEGTGTEAKVFAMRSVGATGYVVARVMATAMDEGEYFESSTLWDEPSFSD